jgi:hypothetical protein
MNERVFYYHTSNRVDAGHLQNAALRAEVSPDGTKRPRARAPTVGFLSHGNPWEKGLYGYGKEKIREYIGPSAAKIRFYKLL